MAEQPAKMVAYGISELVELADGDQVRMINPAHELFLDSKEANRYAEELIADGVGKSIRWVKVRIV
jgi:hypothetical protein